MMFDLIRWGWPNTAAILALAALPLLALATPAKQTPATIAIVSVDSGQFVSALADRETISE